MKQITKLSISITIAFILFGVSEILAKQHDHLANHHDRGHVASPFDSVKKTNQQHCLLMGQFHHRKGVCPHSKAIGDGAALIATDCGGKTPGSTPNLSTSSSDYEETRLNSFSHSHLIKKITITSPFSYKHYFDLLDPPPKLA